MPFVPHTDDDVQAMLRTIGVDRIDTLFDEIPAHLRSKALTGVPEGRSEMAMLQHMQARAQEDANLTCFLGAGCYDHHIPAAVWDLTARGEFMTAYTPYQAEASQGTLQLIYEYQSMIAALTGMEVANASVYDGGSGLGEAILMAVRANKKVKSRRVLVPDTVHPLHLRAATNIVRNQGVEVVPVATADGRLAPDALAGHEDAVALVVQQPNFFGQLEAADALTDWAHANGALLIAVVNPMALAVLKPPGEWGETGADIAGGDGQPLGIPMASGGPSFGFMCAKRALVRQMPGRIIGRTEDLDGKPGYTLTLQAREQHIRRGKATSNICTNQGLLVTAATIHMALLGPVGLRQVAAASRGNVKRLAAVLTALPGVDLRYPDNYFHEVVLTLPGSAGEARDALLAAGVLAGLPLGELFPGRERELLVCATERRTPAEIAAYADALGNWLGRS